MSLNETNYELGKPCALPLFSQLMRMFNFFLSEVRTVFFDLAQGEKRLNCVGDETREPSTPGDWIHTPGVLPIRETIPPIIFIKREDCYPPMLGDLPPPGVQQLLLGRRMWFYYPLIGSIYGGRCVKC